MRILFRVLALGALAGILLLTGVTIAREQETRAVTARSAHFWGLLHVQGSSRYHFASLEEMTNVSDLIVVGRIEQVTPGRVVVDADAVAGGASPEDANTYFGNAKLVVEETIKGTPRQTIALQLLLPSQVVLKEVQQGLPTERAIFYLSDMGAYFAQENPTSDLKTVLKDTFDFSSPQGLVRDLNGSAGVFLEDEDPFLQDLGRRRFEDAVAETRRAAGH